MSELDSEKLKELARKKAEEMQRNIHVTVDNEQTKALAEELAEAKEEAQDMKEKLSLVAEIEINKRLTKHPELSELQKLEFRSDPALLKAYEEGQTINQPASSPAGSSPLNDAQWGKSQNTDDFLKKQYPNSEAMIEDVRSMARNPNNPNQMRAQAVLDKFMENWRTAKRENPSKPDEFPNLNSAEEMAKLGLVNKDGFLVSSDPNFDSFGRKKKWLDKNPRIRKAKQQTEGN